MFLCLTKIITNLVLWVAHLIGYLIYSGPSLHLIIECHQARKFCTNLTTKTHVLLHADYISYYTNY